MTCCTVMYIVLCSHYVNLLITVTENKNMYMMPYTVNIDYIEMYTHNVLSTQVSEWNLIVSYLKFCDMTTLYLFDHFKIMCTQRCP